MFALKRATFAFGLRRSDCHVDLLIFLAAFGYFVGWALPLIQIEAITKHAGHNMRATPIAYSSETMTAFGPHGPSLWDRMGVTLIGPSARPTSQSLGATNSAHSRAGEVHPEEWGTGSNSRGVFSGRMSLTTPITGGCSSPRAIAHRMAR